MRKIVFVLMIMLVAVTVYAQDIQRVAKAKDTELAAVHSDTLKKWMIQGSTSLAFSQAAFSNWSSGGQNSIGLVGFINLKANYRSGKHLWANTVDLGYGFNILGKGGDAKYTKTNDKIELTTAYGFQLSKNKKWLVTALANFRTQFTAGYNYPDDSTVISNFLAPGYLVIGAGITYAPASWFTLYVSPASGRFTFVNDTKLSDAGAFGVDKGKKMAGQCGPYLRADMNKELAKNINLTSNLELFTDYLHDFGNIDVNWNLLLSLKVNKWLAASIQTQLIYDNDITIKTSATDPGGPRTQFKELLGIGLTYMFNR